MKHLTNPVDRALQHPSRKNAIDAKCAECMGCTPGYMEPGFRQSISECSVQSCPLHPFRPYRESDDIKTAKKGVL